MMSNEGQHPPEEVQNSNNAGLPPGLIPRQEIVDVEVPSIRADALHAHIMGALAQKPAHRIVTITMATYGEFPLYYRVLIVIEYL